MDLRVLLIVGQIASTEPARSNPNTGAGAIIAGLFVLLLLGAGAIGIAFLVRNSARARGHDDGFCTAMLLLAIFIGPVIPLIIIYSTQGRGNKYTQLRRPGRPPLPPGGRRPGPRPRPGMPNRRLPSVPQFAPAPQAFAAPPPPVEVAPAPPGFLNCPRCGQQNGVARDDCWSCGLGFHPSMKPPADNDLEDIDYLPDGQGATPQASVETVKQTSSPGEETVKQAETVGEETVKQAPEVGEETVIKEQVASQPTERVVKIRCRDCNKKFSGRESIIEKLQTCPKCKAFPFQHDPA